MDGTCCSGGYVMLGVLALTFSFILLIITFTMAALYEKSIEVRTLSPTKLEDRAGVLKFKIRKAVEKINN